MKTLIQEVWHNLLNRTRTPQCEKHLGRCEEVASAGVSLGFCIHWDAGSHSPPQHRELGGKATTSTQLQEGPLRRRHMSCPAAAEHEEEAAAIQAGRGDGQG